MGNTAPKAPLLSQVEHLARYMLRKAGARGILGLGFLLLGSLTEGISILLLVPVLELVGPGGGTVTLHVPTPLLAGVLGPQIHLGLIPVLGFLILLVFVQALFMRFKNIYMAELLYDFINHLRVSLFESIGRARWLHVARVRGSDLHHALTADIDRVQSASFHLLLLVQGCILLAVYLFVSSLVSLAMTIFAFLAGGAVLAALHPIRRRAFAYGRLLTQNRQEQYRTVSEFLAGIKVAKSFNAEPRYLAELAFTLKRMRSDFTGFLRVSSLGTVLFQAANALVLATFVYVALARFALPLPKIIVLIFVFLRVWTRFTSLQSDVQAVLVDLPAFAEMQRIKADCDREQEQAEPPDQNPPFLRQKIRFDNVTFRYAGDGSSDVLTSVSFVVPAQQITALIGASGSGKSTLADMLMGLLEPATGAVVIDDRVLDERSRRCWRDQVAYVPQDVFLLHDTIAANLRLAATEASQPMMWESLRAAYADGFVERLPDGLQTVIGDRGIRLSGGERQRIALARALLRRPQLLILDEATSALDWENQALIARSIEELRGSMTIITIAHRLSMIAFADWIVALKAGKVVESGPYEQLMRVKGSQLARLVAGEQAERGTDNSVMMPAGD